MSQFPLFSSPLVVEPHEVVLEYVDGALRRTLRPGRYRSPARARRVAIDTRTRLGYVAPQDVLTADGVSVRVTGVMRWVVADAAAFVESSTDAAGEVYLSAQIALRDAVASYDVAGLLSTGRRALTLTVTEAVQAASTPLGITVYEVVLRDVMLPADLRSAYAEQVTARERGKAALEAARAETAALRSLANAAKLLDEHPSLAKQRLVEALPPGSTVRLRD